MLRPKTYAVIDSERDYQDIKWPAHRHGIASYILYAQHHLQKASAFASTGPEKLALKELRKTAALLVACFEKHGVPYRSKTDA